MKERPKKTDLTNNRLVSMVLLGAMAGLLLLLFDFKINQNSLRRQTEPQVLNQPSPEELIHRSRVQSEQIRQRITSHMQEVENKNSLRGLKAEAGVPDLGEPLGLAPGRLQALKRLEAQLLRESDAEERVFKDLQSDLQSTPRNAQERINQLVAKDQFEEDVVEKADEAYIDQFLANARAAGYEVILDESYEVISVKPIKRKPSQY